MSKRMKWYAVRCCCTPRRVLGFLKLEDRDEDGERFVAVRDRDENVHRLKIRRLSGICRPEPIPMTTAREAVERPLEQTQFVDPRTEELAVYGEDRPLDFWMRLHDFIPTTSEELEL